MISMKFLGPNGGTLANAVKALDYLTDLKTRHGINIVASNNSWGGGGYSSALHSAIIRGANAGILFVAAAGNGGSDGLGDSNDSLANYPSNYSTLQGTKTTKAAAYEAVVAVAALNSDGSLASTVSSVSAPESQGVFSFVVSLNRASTTRVTVNFATANGTATGGRNGDYTATSGTLTFNPGETSKLVNVAVRNDASVEPDETFFVRLSSAVGATIAAGAGTGTIVNDDGVTTQATLAAFAIYGVSSDSIAGTSTKKNR